MRLSSSSWFFSGLGLWVALAACGGKTLAGGPGGGGGAGGSGGTGDAGPDGTLGGYDGDLDVVVVQDSSVDSGGSGETGPFDASDGSVPPSDAGGPPPPPVDAGKPTSTAWNFAVNDLLLGDRDFSGKSNPGAWKNFGYDIDGKITTATSTNVCTLHGGGGSFGTNAQIDGNGGIDNSFGENIVANILLAIDATFTKTLDDDIRAGDFTSLFEVVGLDATSTQTSTMLTAQAFLGGQFAGTPTFTTADDWPVLSTTLTTLTPPLASSQQFPSSYVVNGTFVSGPPGDLSLNLSISGIPLPLLVHRAVVTFDHASPTAATNGQISGVLNTSELLATIQNVAGHISLSLCGAGALSGILEEIRDAQDIGLDGTSTPGVGCDAISIGLGFTAKQIALPDQAQTATTSPNPCGDGG